MKLVRTMVLVPQPPLPPIPKIQTDFYLESEGQDLFLGSVRTPAIQVPEVPPPSVGSVVVTPNGAAFPPGRVYVVALTEPVVYGYSSSTLFVIDGFDDIDTATVSAIAGLPPYKQLALSPIPGDDRIFAVWNGGVDAIVTSTNEVVSNSLPSWGSSIAVGRTEDGHDRAYVTDSTFRFPFPSQGGRTTVHVIDLPSASLVGEIEIGAGLGSLALSPDGKFLVVTQGAGIAPEEERQRVHIVETATDSVIRTVEVGGFPNDVAISGDSSLAFVTTTGAKPGVQLLFLQRPRLSSQALTASDLVQSIPDSAFVASPPQVAARRAALQAKFRVVQQMLEQAEGSTGTEKQGLLIAANNKIENDILPKMDGCFGGGPQKDWVVPCDAQELLVHSIRALEKLIESEEEPSEAETFPEGSPVTFPEEPPEELD